MTPSHLSGQPLHNEPMVGASHVANTRDVLGLISYQAQWWNFPCETLY